MPKTALFEVHKELDAKMAPVNNWDMPLYYPGGSVAEHRHCRSAAVIFDGGNRKLWQFAGDISDLDKNFLYPLTALQVGCAAENIMLTPEGKMAAKFTVCRMQENDLLAIADPNCTTPFPGGNELSGMLSSFTLLGKKAAEVLTNACDEKSCPGAGNWQKLSFTDENETFRAISVAVERFGECGFEFIFDAGFAADIYEMFYRDTTVAPAGIQAYESLRVESATPAWGSELNCERTPQECDLLSSGASGNRNVRIISAVMPRHPAKPGDKICDKYGKELGGVTSGAFCPSENCAKIIGFVNASCDIVPGTEIVCGGIPAVVK